MNQRIKEILEKHIDIDQLLPDFYHEDLNNALVEICEEQKIQTSKDMIDSSSNILKNIAHE